MTLLAQSPVKDFFDGIIAVIREVGEGGMIYVGIIIGAIGFAFMLKALKRMGIVR